jgi:hypothetical protein
LTGFGLGGGGFVGGGFVDRGEAFWRALEVGLFVGGRRLGFTLVGGLEGRWLVLGQLLPNFSGGL